MQAKLVLFLLLSMASLEAFAARANIWPSIPFIRGADLCQYNDTFGQSRSEYMDTMVGHASELMGAGALGNEALQLLVAFDALHDKNRALALRGKYLDATLEANLKAELDAIYRRARLEGDKRKISFRHVNHIRQIVEAAKRGQRIGHFTDAMLNQLDYIAYGSYALAPDCRGKIQVTIHMVGRDGELESFSALGRPHQVMALIAGQMYNHFQRTRFPSTLRLGNRNLTILGTLTGNAHLVDSTQEAEQACQYMGGRLPNKTELQLIDGFGDHNGGINIGRFTWVIAHGQLYAGSMRSQPIRRPFELNDKRYYYYCIK